MKGEINLKEIALILLNPFICHLLIHVGNCLLLHLHKKTHRLRERTYGYQGGRVVGREIGTDMYTLLYLKWITSKDLLYSTGNSTQCNAAGWMGGEFGGEWIHVYVWLSRFVVKLSQRC